MTIWSVPRMADSKQYLVTANDAQESADQSTKMTPISATQWVYSQGILHLLSLTDSRIK